MCVCMYEIWTSRTKGHPRTRQPVHISGHPGPHYETIRIAYMIIIVITKLQY